MQSLRDRRRGALERACGRLERRLTDLKQRSTRLSWARLWMFLAATICSFTAFAVTPWLGGVTALLGFGAFAAVVGLHGRVERAAQRCELWLEIKRTHAARQTLDWARLPAAAHVAVPSDHPFGGDLNIVGERSLHQLLDTTTTTEASGRLAAWLLAYVPNVTTIAVRQTLTGELATQPLFRDKLRLWGRAADRGGTRGHVARLRAWLDEAAPSDLLGVVVAFLWVNAAVTLALALLTAAEAQPPVWAASFVVYFGVSLTQARALMGLFDEVTGLQDSLRQIYGVFSFLEHYHYRDGSRLQALCAPFVGADRPAQWLGRLNRVVAAAGIRSNALLWLLLNALIPWDLTFVYLLRRYQKQLRSQLPAWLDLWHELEALSALGTFAYLNPDYTFPTISREEGVWQGSAVGHPLIAVERRVNNDVVLPGLGHLLLVTGSNMSGKSTFLRTVGINTALAYTGSVVAAEALTLAPLRLYTAIQIVDSLTDGFSYFYAEVRRLKALLDALESDDVPLLYLIDELFRGTNNRERLAGSRAYLQALARADARGMGLVSTHDLELTQLAGERIHNFHFTERIEDERLVFDYRLYAGPSQTTNALAIMRLAGLPVPEDDGST